MSRLPLHYYQDPLDAVWIAAAAKMGVNILRSRDTYASWDGQRNLTLSDPAGMDTDDCLAQMILHELCHSLVQGSQSFGWIDWGLDNEGARDTALEHACLRLQAALLTPLGLRKTLAPTTDFRTFYDDLPEDPFEERSPDERESIVRARAAYARRNRRPWRGHLQQALETSAEVFLKTREALGNTCSPDSLLSTVAPQAPRNPVGLPAHHDSTRRCKDCAWAARHDGPGLRCTQADSPQIEGEFEACERFEEAFDCLSCGACCREAYDTVEVADDDPAAKIHLPLLVERSGGYDMRREGPRCTCLNGGIPLRPTTPAIAGGTASPDEGLRNPPLLMPGGQPFTCSIYETRPQTCRDFTIYSEHCLSARRTVGLSR
jgi:Fe-S-cluster containining protein